MHATVRVSVAIAVALSMAACSKSKSSPTTEPALTVTPTIVSGAVASVSNGVKANGTNTVTIAVANGTSGPIGVEASRGTFPNGTNRATIEGTSGSVTLTVCDARTSTSCAGRVVISAVDAASASGSAAVTFVGFETTCNDTIDNNADSATDCADPDCATRPCSLNGTAGTCASGACALPTCTPSNATEICGNGVDDNCAGGSDCADAACNGQACDTSSPTSVCQSGSCTDLASGLALTVESARARLPADGAGTSAVTVTVKADDVAQSGASVLLTTDLGAFVTATGTATSVTVSTGPEGTAVVTFRAPATAGTATIRASPTTLPTLVRTTTVVMPVLGAIRTTELTVPVQGVKFSGWNEQGQIAFQVLDSDGKPYPDGLEVRIQHRQLGGSELQRPWAADGAGCTQANRCLTYLGATRSPAGTADAEGLATVNFFSGTTAGLASISATATASGRTLTNSIHVPVVGAKPSGAHLALDCSPKNLPALAFNRTCVETFYGGDESPIHCTAYFADRFNNVLGREIVTEFASEAGAAGPPAYTAAYNPASTSDQTATLGFARNTVAVTGYALPADVAAITGEPSQQVAGACGTITHNPRDGLVTIIALARGEEGFVDRNGDGLWNTGEPWIDLGEPYVDANDDGARQVDEYYVDVNGDGSWNGPNGAWDEDATIWTEARVLFTGAPYDVTMAAATTMPIQSTRIVPFAMRDVNLNPITPFATYAATSTVPAVATAEIFQAPSSVDSLGMVYTRQYCDQPASGTPTVCSSVCPTAPCFIVPRMGSFGQAASGSVRISSTATAGSTTVSVNTTIDAVTFVGAASTAVTVGP